MAIAFVALVFALTGVSFAASTHGGGSIATAAKSKAKPKAKTGPRGPAGPRGKTGKTGATGATGAAGPAGAAGPKGETGAAGANGEKGEKGTSGENGTNGVSVTSREFSGANGSCKEGGSEFTAADGKTTLACDGKEGSPWTAGGTLPAGKSEKGAWAAGGMPAPNPGLSNAEMVSTSISFPIPLAAGLDTGQIHVFEGDTIPVGCTGTLGGSEEVLDLGAEPGNLCIYVRVKLNVSLVLPAAPETGKLEAAGPAGSVVYLIAENAEGAFASGTWAVSAPAEA
jgi:hypothetical protein